MSQLWGGRFQSTGRRESVKNFGDSLRIDKRLWLADLRASQAHAEMLGRQKILSGEESRQLVEGLEQLKSEWQGQLAAGKDPFQGDHEDIHSFIESRLREKIGAVAGKLHTARSRNDQVATAFRLTLAELGDSLAEDLKKLITTLIERAEPEFETLIPGMTHFQAAQPVSLAHHLLAYAWMSQRDRERIFASRSRLLQLPLGSAALAGTSFPLDREFVAKKLEFSGICENSLDAVSDRDFLVEALSNLSLVMMHLSRLSEELIIWSSPNFGFVELADDLTTGSSIMPQKKNPDMAELTRGKVGVVYGHLISALTMMKGLPLSYNRDMQEDKTMAFGAYDTVFQAVNLMTEMMGSAQFRREKMAAALAGDFSNATDLADDLAKKGVPFREAHEVVGRVVRWCLETKRQLESLTLSELQSLDARFDEVSLACLPHLAVMMARTSRGGTAPASVRHQLAVLKVRVQG